MTSNSSSLTTKLHSLSASNHQAVVRAFKHARAISNEEANELAQAVERANTRSIL